MACSYSNSTRVHNPVVIEIKPRMSILVDIKRRHDRDKSGWWMPILFVPIIGAIWLFLAGTPGPNRFGGPVMD